MSSFRASRAAIRRSRRVSARCCRPAGARDRSLAAGRPRPSSRPAAQGRVVRHREIDTEQGDDGTDQPFGLPKGQAEHGSQRQRRRNSQGRIARLTSSRRPWFSLPGRDRRVGEPDRQAAALPQGRVVGRRVRDPVTLIWDVVTTLGIGFERQGPTPDNEGNTPSSILPQPMPRRSMQQSPNARQSSTTARGYNDTTTLDEVEVIAV